MYHCTLSLSHYIDGHQDTINIRETLWTKTDYPPASDCLCPAHAHLSLPPWRTSLPSWFDLSWTPSTCQLPFLQIYLRLTDQSGPIHLEEGKFFYAVNCNHKPNQYEVQCTNLSIRFKSSTIVTPLHIINNCNSASHSSAIVWGWLALDN